MGTTAQAPSALSLPLNSTGLLPAVDEYAALHLLLFTVGMVTRVDWRECSKGIRAVERETGRAGSGEGRQSKQLAHSGAATTHRSQLTRVTHWASPSGGAHARGGTGTSSTALAATQRARAGLLLQLQLSEWPTPVSAKAVDVGVYHSVCHYSGTYVRGGGRAARSGLREHWPAVAVFQVQRSCKSEIALHCKHVRQSVEPLLWIWFLLVRTGNFCAPPCPHVCTLPSPSACHASVPAG